MKVSDLQTGWIVKMRNGQYHLVFRIHNDLYVSDCKYSWTNLNDGYDGFLLKNDCVYDLIEVYKPKGGYVGSFLQLELVIESNYLEKWGELVYKEEIVETIEICGIRYKKQDVENALKDLKPIK